MNSIPMEVATLGQVSPCWLFENRAYRYIVNGFEQVLLPTVDEEYLPVLEEMGIPYRPATENKYEYWKAGCFKEEEVRLPLYRTEGKKYKFTKNYTKAVVTSETKEAAFELSEDVEKRIELFQAKKKRNETIQYLRQMLAGEEAIGVDYLRNPFLTTTGINYYKILDLIADNEHIRIFPVKALMNTARAYRWRNYCCNLMMDEDEIDYTLDTDYIAIFDMTKIQDKDEIDIKVPEGKKGLYIGRKAWQLKEWCRSIGVRRINVIEAE